MGGITKLRGIQTRASDSYNPDDVGLASDAEVEARVRKHSKYFHHNRDDVTKLTFDSVGNLTEIKTYNNDNEDKLYAESLFDFDDLGNLTEIEIKIYEEDSDDLYMHLKKTFNFDDYGNLTKIDNEVVV